MIVDLTFLIGFALLLLRIIVAIILFSSGKGHVQNPKERAESIGMPPTATLILGIAEMVAAISIALGIFTQIGAAIIIITMLGAISKKIFVWKTGFYAEKRIWLALRFIHPFSLFCNTYNGGWKSCNYIKFQ